MDSSVESCGLYAGISGVLSDLEILAEFSGQINAGSIRESYTLKSRR